MLTFTKIIGSDLNIFVSTGSKTKEYKKLSPKMKEAVDNIFAKMDAKPSDFLNTFEKTIREVSKKYKVPEKQLMNYFEKEMLAI